MHRSLPRRRLTGAAAALVLLASCGDPAAAPLSPGGESRAAPERPSALLSGPYAIVRVSGAGPVGTTDPANQFHNGSAWVPAFIVAPDSQYAPPIAGTNYISTTPNSAGQPTSTTTFRTTFTLPAGWTAPSLVIAVHADNAVTSFRLNGNFFGAHTSNVTPANFQGPAEVFATASAASFATGVNTLEFDLRNNASTLGSPTQTALDYHATVQFSCLHGEYRFGRCLRIVKYVVLGPKIPLPVETPVKIPLPPARRVRVALLGSKELDVSEVDRGTVELGGAKAVAEGGEPEDVNRDGFRDLVFHVAARALEAPSGEREVCITGTASGIPFEGCAPAEGSR